MDREAKIKLSKQVMLIAGSFSLLVSFLLVFNFIQMKSNDPIDSETMEALVQRLAEDPRNEDLKKEIRNFDLLARKAYFTSTWQVNTGAWLLLIGSVVFVIALKVYSDQKWKIDQPGEEKENPVLAAYTAQRWLLIVGLVLIVLAIGSAVLTKNYLSEYSVGIVKETPGPEPENKIEVIAISQEPDTVISPENTNEISENLPPELKMKTQETTQEDLSPVPSKIESKFNPEDFKSNQAGFRGYMGQGVSFHKNIPVDWDGAAGINVKWKVSLDKPGFNTPVIWGDKIFLSGGDEESRVVYCFDRHSGRLLWEKVADGIPGSPANPPNTTDDTGLAAPTMVVDGKRVYAVFGTGDIISFDMEGKRVWARNLGVPSNHYGHSSSLSIWNGKLLVQYDTSAGGRMLALNSSSGETVWDISRSNMISWSSPMLLEKDGKIQVVTTSDPLVAGYDLDSGEELWTASVLMGEVAPSAACFDGVVYATNEYAITVALDPSANGQILWETDEYLSEVSSPVAYKGILFLATSYGVLVAYDAKTGENIWEKQFDGGFYSSPMIAEDKLYIADMEGVMHILNADRTGNIIAEPELGEAVFALPVFSDGRIYIRGKESLFCIENEN